MLSKIEGGLAEGIFEGRRGGDYRGGMRDGAVPGAEVGGDGGVAGDFGRGREGVGGDGGAAGFGEGKSDEAYRKCCRRSTDESVRGRSGGAARAGHGAF